jgi:hypothetical protein
MPALADVKEGTYCKELLPVWDELVCRKSFAQLYGFSINFVDKWCCASKTGMVFTPNAPERLGGIYVRNTQYNPASVNSCCLHSIHTKKEVYEKYRAHELSQGYEEEEICTLAAFYACWTSKFGTVKLSRKETFGVCSVCYVLEAMQEAAEKDNEPFAQGAI